VPCCDQAKADPLPSASTATVALSASLRSALRADAAVVTRARGAALAATMNEQFFMESPS
jgi:hypothetical protein